MKMILVGLLVIAIIAVIGAAIVLIRAGIIGKSYFYHECERGYYTYPYGVTDSSSTYYDQSGRMIGECRSWIAGDTCKPAKEAVGVCRKDGDVRWGLF